MLRKETALEVLASRCNQATADVHTLSRRRLDGLLTKNKKRGRNTQVSLHLASALTTEFKGAQILL